MNNCRQNLLILFRKTNPYTRKIKMRLTSSAIYGFSKLIVIDAPNNQLLFCSCDTFFGTAWMWRFAIFFLTRKLLCLIRVSVRLSLGTDHVQNIHILVDPVHSATPSYRKTHSSTRHQHTVICLHVQRKHVTI